MYIVTTYWYIRFMFLFAIGSMALLQEPHIDINYDFAQLAIGAIIGLVPGIITAYAARRRWYGGEKDVTVSQASLNQSVAVENLAQAASILAEQSQKLNDKHAALITTYESALEKQREMIAEQERTIKEQEKFYLEEIETLKKQIDEINQMVISCSREIMQIIHDLRDGKEIDLYRIQELEDKWTNL